MFNRGYPTVTDLKEKYQYPSDARLKKGPVVICECVENIPCDPCETACKFNAIKIGSEISNIPEVDFDRCTGCSLCVAACPGLAIFVLDKSYSGEKGKVTFPYEYPLQLTEKLVVNANDRTGQVVCSGIITKIIKTKKLDGTAIVTIEVPIQFVDEVRGIGIESACIN